METWDSDGTFSSDIAEAAAKTLIITGQQTVCFVLAAIINPYSSGWSQQVG